MFVYKPRKYHQLWTYNRRGSLLYGGVITAMWAVLVVMCHLELKHFIYLFIYLFFFFFFLEWGWLAPVYLLDIRSSVFNPLFAELNPICHLLALLGVHHFLHVSRIRVKSLTLRLLMSIYIYMEHLFLMFLDHTRRTTVSRTPLEEWSARRRDLYLSTHDTHNRQISMPQ